LRTVNTHHLKVMTAGCPLTESMGYRSGFVLPTVGQVQVKDAM